MADSVSHPSGTDRAGLTIAIDGPASSGKGTVARGVARALGYAYVDTGAMYRSVALIAVQRGIELEDEVALAGLTETLDFQFSWDGDLLRIRVDGQDVTSLIRTDDVGNGASVVSRHPGVRAALLGRQQDLGGRGEVVMDGRDIGTVVLPGADLKVYLDADLDERALRRHEELLRRGGVQRYEDVRSAIAQRDRQDTERAVAPLRMADDAVRLDTTELTIRQAIDTVLSLAVERGA